MLQSILHARLRALVLILCALLLASGAMATTARPAAATGGACGGSSWFTDSPGVAYDNGDYREAPQAGQFWDSWQGKYTRLRADIRSWRYTTTGNDGWPAGHCLRRIRVSVWVDDGSYGNIWLNWHEWVCGTLVENGVSNAEFAGGQERYAGWTDYSGCGGPNADMAGHGKNADWTPYWPGEVPAPYTNLP